MYRKTGLISGKLGVLGCGSTAFGYDFYDPPDRVSTHEVSTYLNEPVLPLEETPYQWWWHNRDRFARRSKMAFEL